MRKHKYLSMVVVVAISFSGTGYSLANQEPKKAYDDSEQVIGGSVQDLEKKDEGWFFYNEKQVTKPKPIIPTKPKPDTPKPKPVEPKLTPAPAPAPEPKFTVKWYRENIQKLRDEAIDNPTKENVRRYYYVQRIMLDKASRYADMARLVTTTDPFIDENNRRSTSSFAAMEQTRVADENRGRVLNSISSKAGIFFFFKGKDCPLCEKQAFVLKTFSHETSINVIPISVDGFPLPQNEFNNMKIDTGQAKKLGITNVPAIALAIPPKDIRIISFSAISSDSLKERTVLIAKDAKLISEQDYTSTLPLNHNGYIDSDIIKDMPDDILNDPILFVEYIQKRSQVTKP
ncbi:conjugal transfer protein TraF [Morganella morganii]|uniref:conjugal transfer protein TraF n=1 Tax=Proteus terrae TaxID=1574161 RepID=UPI001A1DD42A|nr:conjugal transfer protein TraF [Proteus mirabilis]MBI6519775.1 conjugal transfer protein TraF [Proteus mirabilis]